MTKPNRSTTERGFATYDEFKDDYGADVMIRESSAAQVEGEDRGPWVWFFVRGGAVDDNEGSAHLGPDQARRARDALSVWLREVCGERPFEGVDDRKLADLVRSHRDLYHALYGITALEDFLSELENAVQEAQRALRAEPEFDAIPDYVQVDPSWADALPVCVECGKEVPWADALLMPCSTTSPDDEADTMGVVHRRGCPE
jgi:hypothetical protein